MNLIRLERHQHPRPPHQELRQKTVFDPGCRNIGQVTNLYVDDDMDLRFLGVCTSGKIWADGAYSGKEVAKWREEGGSLR